MPDDVDLRGYEELGLSEQEAREAHDEGYSVEEVRTALLEEADRQMGPIGEIRQEMAEARETPHQRAQRIWGVG